MEVPGIRELRRKRVQPLWPWLPGKGLKRLEVEKTLSKVTTENKSNNQGIQLGNKGPGTEVVVFLSRGTSVQGGNTKDRWNRPLLTYNQFRKRRYFQKEPLSEGAKLHTSQEQVQQPDQVRVTPTPTSFSTLGIHLHPITHLESMPEARRLKLCSENWRILTSDPWILQAVVGYRLELLADPTQRGIPIEIPARKGADDYRGNPETVSDEGCPTGDHATRSVCQPGLSGSQEGWLTTASGKFKITELPHCKEEIQDGGSKINSRSDQERRLDGHDRPKGCSSFGTYFGKASSLSEVFVGRAAVRIPVPSLRPVQ